MADKAFDRVVINPRERPLSTDINQAQSEMSQTLREVLRGIFSMRPSGNALASGYAGNFTPANGFLSDGFLVVSAGIPLQLTLRKGLGLAYDASLPASSIDGVQGLDDFSPYCPIYLSSDQVLTIPSAPPSGQERIDIIEVRMDRRRADSSSRDVLDPGTGVFNPSLVQKTLSYDLLGRNDTVASPSVSTSGISYKTGTPQAAGVFASSNGVTGIPATTAGYQRVAVVYVPDTGIVSTTNGIRDARQLLFPSSIIAVGFTFSQTPGTPDVLAGLSSVQLPTSIRVGFLPQGSGVLRICIFPGQITTAASAVTAISSPGATLASANRFVKKTRVTYANLSEADRTAMAAVSGLPLNIQVGTPYLYVDVDSALNQSGDSVDTARVYEVIATLSLR